MPCRLFIFAVLLPAACVLSACVQGGAPRNSQWDRMDYVRISRDRVPQDNDAFYSPPIIRGCLDDAPGSECQ